MEEKGGHRDAVVCHTGFLHSKVGGLETTLLFMTTLWAPCPKRAPAHHLTPLVLCSYCRKGSSLEHCLPPDLYLLALLLAQTSKEPNPCGTFTEGEINESGDCSHFFFLLKSHCFWFPGSLSTYREVSSVSHLSQRTSSGFTPL